LWRVPFHTLIVLENDFIRLTKRASRHLPPTAGGEGGKSRATLQNQVGHADPSPQTGDCLASRFRTLQRFSNWGQNSPRQRAIAKASASDRTVEPAPLSRSRNSAASEEHRGRIVGIGFCKSTANSKRFRPHARVNKTSPAHANTRATGYRKRSSVRPALKLEEMDAETTQKQGLPPLPGTAAPDLQYKLMLR